MNIKQKEQKGNKIVESRWNIDLKKKIEVVGVHCTMHSSVFTTKKVDKNWIMVSLPLKSQ